MTTAERAERLKTDIDKVFEAGIEDAKQAFTDSFQMNGTRTNYHQAFQQTGWNDETFAYIRYPIICSADINSGNYMFYRCGMTRIHIPVTLNGCEARETFNVSSSLETIDSLTFINVPEFRTTFGSCGKLKNITFGKNAGTIGKVDEEEGGIGVNISFSACSKLTSTTVDNIIAYLIPNTEETQPKVTFHSDVLASLTTDQILAITAKNWTI